MITIDNVAVEELVCGLPYPGLLEYTEFRGINTIGELLNILKKLPDVDWDVINKRMAAIYKVMERNNEDGKEPVIFHPREYSDSSLNAMDTLNEGRILMIGGICSRNSRELLSIRSMQISRMKSLLSLVTKNGDNAFLWLISNVGKTDIPKIINLLDMYTLQIERQANLTSRRDINLFEYQLETRKEIVQRYIVDILSYLIHDTKGLIWEELTDYKRPFYESALKKDNKVERKIKQKTVEYVAGYTTLPELEQVMNGDYEVLKRFKKN